MHLNTYNSRLISMSIQHEIPIEQYIPILTDGQILTEKDWAAGSKEILEQHTVIFDAEYRASLRTVNFAPAWYKCFDEVLVNAIDQYINKIGSNAPVRNIDVTFTRDGTISVRNDGSGVRIEWHPIAKMWAPELIFGCRDRGTNMRKDAQSITGGTNGLGAKVANAFSDMFNIETVYANGRSLTYYSQKWYENMSRRDTPVIIDLVSGKRKCFDAGTGVTSDDPANTADHKKILPINARCEHTTVSFRLSYEKIFKYKTQQITSQTQHTFNALSDETYAELLDIIRTRIIKCAVYVGGGAVVTLNGHKIPFHTLDQILKALYPESPIFKTVITPTSNGEKQTSHPWEIAVAVVPNDTGKLMQISNVNGVATNGGDHIDLIIGQIIEHMTSMMAKKTSDNVTVQRMMIYSNIFLCMNVKVPGVSWNSQSKENMSIGKRKIAHYILDIKFLNGVCKALTDAILIALQDRELTKSLKTTILRRRRSDIDVPKYDGAQFAGGAESHLCRLLLPEGDSAALMCQRGLTAGGSNAKLNTQYFGIFTLGGVIPNVRKETKTIVSGKRTSLHPSTMLRNNKFWTNFLTVTGLDINARYDPASPTYALEIRKLRYGGIIVCVDQDVDGVGHIFSLIINMFELYWKKLLERGFIQRFNTPLIRAFPNRGGVVRSFYTSLEYQKWAEINARDINKYEIKYYKGLGSHDSEATKSMFAQFTQTLLTYIVDPEAAHKFEVYFGENVMLRKIEFSKPFDRDTVFSRVDEEVLTHNIKCTTHLDAYGKEFALDDIQRKLWSVMDGMNESNRKIFNGSIQYFKNRDVAIKVFQLAGAVAESQQYHHGEQILTESIIGMAQLFVGAVQLPKLIPSGEFGSRVGGGNDHANARYIYVKFNHELNSVLYAFCDMRLLKYVVDEGHKCEPKYFVPIIPTAIAESCKVPSHGWALTIWARDVFDIIRNVRRFILQDEPTKTVCYPMRVFSRGFKGRFGYIHGRPFSFGSYIFDEEKHILRITELPLRVWSKPYKEKIKKKCGHFIEDMSMESTDDVNIVIWLKRDVTIGNITMKTVDYIRTKFGDEPYLDPFEDLFALRKSLNSDINLYGIDDQVIEFGDRYEDIFRVWYPERRHLYVERVKRYLIVMELEIIYYDEIIRYVSEYKKLNIFDAEETRAEEILITNGYRKLNHAACVFDSDIETHMLRDTFYGQSANYSYLLDITDRQRLRSANQKRLQTREMLATKLRIFKEKAAIGKFPGAQMWMDELDELEKIIKQGQAVNWNASVNKYKYGGSK